MRNFVWAADRIAKLRENCLSEFEKHWNCLEYNNQVRFSPTARAKPAFMCCAV